MFLSIPYFPEAPLPASRDLPKSQAWHAQGALVVIQSIVGRDRLRLENRISPRQWLRLCPQVHASLSISRKVSRLSTMARLRSFLLTMLCIGFVIQSPVQAMPTPQSEKMLASDCAEMMHHSEGDEPMHSHNGNTDAPCEGMSADCLLATNAVSPVWVGSDAPSHVVKPFSDGPVYLSNITSPLLSRASAPDYPPPRI
ncbi:hypothetical protein WYH_02584 [Croceibacterium atlanticum]|uniref:DUF2946 domain-containing protein n=1 Tax=Croceibacterium atlanticum TaxID=1267766 RepID=A0A0F7KVC9_9SPHN|nr:hypothetical protein WYH_02584 [Croceibacterium atlanticum]